MTRLRLPIWHRLLRPELLADALADTVRHRDGRQRLPLPVGIGACVFVDDITPSELARAAAELEATASVMADRQALVTAA
jgi:3-dehydroquinate synthase